jgi:sulfatase maturation enzyme AslB (radical SAM superfamily)
MLPLLAVLAMALVAASAPAAASVAPPPADRCAQVKIVDGWCKAGNVGYVASVEVRSRFLFDVLDVHGHQVDPSVMHCETCQKAFATHGFCPLHRMGYVGGKAFMSPLTYYIHRGKRLDPAAIRCPVCRRDAQGSGWCDEHRRGMIGPIALDDRSEFDEAQKAYAILHAAIDMSAKCERCAGAMIANGYCAIHKVQYRDGLPVTGTPPS